MKKYVAFILLISTIIFSTGCFWGSKNKKVLYQDQEYKNTFINVKTKTLHFGIPVQTDFEVWLRCDSFSMDVDIKNTSAVSMVQIPDIIFNYAKNKTATFNVWQSNPFKELFRYKLIASDWLDTSGIKKGLIAPYKQ